MPTRADLLTHFRLDRSLKSTSLVSDAQAVVLLNQGALALADDGDAFIIGSDTWAGVASQSQYVLSGASAQISNFLDIYWPAGGLVYKPTSSVTRTAPNDFQVVSESWLNLNLPGWQDATASDTLQKIFLSFNASGYLVLGVHPKTSSTTPTFKLYFKSRGTDMSATTSYPWTNTTTNLVHTEPYQIGISYYAMYKAHETFTLNRPAALHYRALYQEKAVGLKQSQAKIFSAENQGLRDEALVIASSSFGGL